MSEEHGRFTTQGLEVYTEFVDEHGTPVKVKDSGAAAPRVWILTHNAHLDLEGARRVRDALDRFIAKHAPHDEAAPAAPSPTGTTSPKAAK
ncbi:MAG: hypothetical protein IRZ11_00765 [Clostridia bacterium]|nr:hypothetical protein [Clostridia bacterium]